MDFSKKSIFIGFLIAMSLLIVSCSPKTPKVGSSVSSATGWTYQNNDFLKGKGSATTGFIAQENYKPQIPAGMVAIEGGTFTMGQKSDLVTAPRNNFSRRVTVGPFYMDQFEVTNLMWREYVHWMEMVFGKSAPHLVQKAMPQIDKSADPLTYNDPYYDRYYTHPAFNNYPVVGITWEQAMDYCQWRTDRVNELILIKAGVIAPPDFSYLEKETNPDSIAQNFVFNTEKYLHQSSYNPKPGPKPLLAPNGSIRKATMADGLMMPNFRLPTEAEWEFAAYALKSGKNGLVEEGRNYPWSGNSIRKNDKGKSQGKIVANFVRGRGDFMGTAGDLNDRYTTTAPGDAYPPNDFGLYNMAGNVNEWILDVYRPTSHQEVAEYNPFRGNQNFTYIAEDQDESRKNELKVDSLGRLMRIVLTDDDFSNYADGMNQIATDFNLYTDPDGLKALRNRSQLDPTDVLAPKYTNKTRVYKGGSWKDRAYWIQPASRRYLLQNQSANDIGFRCVMTMLGSFDNQKQKKPNKK